MLPLSPLYPTTPIILGHRGASAYAPENTLAAFRLALEQGADGVELDVTLSADDAPVVIHDDTLDRTTDGRGPVRAHSLAELKRLDAGRWFGLKFAGERLPTLGEAFAALGRGPLINVELKRDPSGAGRLPERVVTLIREHHLEQRVLISSFHYANLRRVRALAPELPLGLLYDPTEPAGILRAVFAPGVQAEAHHPYFGLVGRLTMRWYRARGVRVNAWTVNSEGDLRRMLSAGVDGIITNHPDAAVRVRAER